MLMSDVCKTWHDLVKKWMSFEYLHKFSTVEQRFVQDRTMEQNKTFDNISNQTAECWFLIFRPTKV